jgi:hypothetical protein
LPATGTASLDALLFGVASVPFAPLSAMRAVLLICVTLLASGSSTVTTKRTELLPFGGMLPKSIRHTLPALMFGLHDQPTGLNVALNVVPVGTTSVMNALGAVTPPVFV